MLIHLSYTISQSKTDKAMTKKYTPSNDSDELNPKYLLQGVAIELLIAIAKGQVDCQQLAKDQLKNIGYDLNGKWVGYGE